jgi:hypothetical protein
VENVVATQALQPVGFSNVLAKTRQAKEAAEKLKLFVILSEAKNPSLVYFQSTERFFGEKRASE